MENRLSPWQALNKGFLRLNPSWQEITPWRDNLLNLLQNIQAAETEEFHKNLIRDFLQKTYYQNNHFINTKGLCDLVVHTGKDTNSPVGLMLEFKSPTNKGEMLKPDQLNVKGLQQLLFYFLDERINQKNFELKHLIVTNCYEWFVFDAQEFERLFIHDQALVKQFKDFREDRLSGSRTNFFYENIASPAIENIQSELKFTYWDLRDYQEVVKKATPDQELTDQERKEVITLFKIFSPEHLLKLPFANDSNSLNQEFYYELLHIIGLTETKQGSKKLIERLPANERNPGSLLEGAIGEIENLGKLSRLSDTERYGNTPEEQLVNVALELVITWVNRILFLKLLEAQLIRYHQGDRTFAFLHIRKLKNFRALNQLFFSILARQIEDRPDTIKSNFANVPYLNSSLFEPTNLELDMIVIGNLNGIVSSILPNTILKDSQGGRLTGEIDTLEYLFEFLDAYDFGSDGTGGIQEKSRSLINAAVLGLIFEKINGYQDGSFYTPGFITMYMCRETIRRAVVQKFNEAKGWNCANFADLKDELNIYIRKSSDRKLARNEANQIINNLKICDPAVGSGHFLVSALNEIIVVKHELGILQDKGSEPLSQYDLKVENDELILTNLNGEFFEYHPKNKESQRVQETLFHEKQTLIENCLFGVDININSVKICQLRLWIELLKNAYYKEDQQLETLPNIDINIKQGNSLISRFPIDADLKSILIARKNKSDIADYRNATHAYFQATDREEKNQAKKIIAEIKQKIKNSLQSVSHQRSKLKKLEQELFNLENQSSLFEESKTEKKTREKKIAKLNNEIDKLKVAIEEEESGLLYANALEWRFEFPEVLNDDGDFIGFDIVIGNPPYFIITKQNTNSTLLNFLLNEYLSIKKSNSKNIFTLFVEKGISLLNEFGKQSMIVPEGFFITRSYADCVEFMQENGSMQNITTLEGTVFTEAHTGNVIFVFGKNSETITEMYNFDHDKKLIRQESKNLSIISKINQLDNILPLNEICNLFKGMVVQDRKSFVFDRKKSNLQNKFLLGNCISKWTINNYKYTNYNKLSIIGGTKLKSKHDVFPRILIRRTGDYLCCAYLEEPALTESTLYSCWSKSQDFDNKYILSLLHSRLFDYYIKLSMITNQQAFPQILMTDLDNLPIKIIKPSKQKVFVNKVNKILTAKKADPNADTTKLEKEIDRLVYELYDLTAEEIAIVENNHP